MVAFQPTFKLMLVSLHLVVLLGLQSTPVLANGLHANHDGNAPVDNAIRRHAARAGRLSKRFPPVPGTNMPTLNRRERHHRFGLTPAQIEELLKDEDVQDSDIYVAASNTTNATSTSSHTRHRTRRVSDSQDPTGTRFHSFALPTSNSTSPSNTTSSEASSATPTSHTQSPLHNSTSSSQSSHNADDTPSSSSASSTALPTSSATQDEGSDGFGGLLGGLLHPSSTSATRAAQQTSASQGQQGNTGSSSSDDNDDQGSTPHSSSRSSSPAATSSPASPTSTASSQPNNSGDNSDDNNDDTSASSSHASKTTQPDFYGFAPQPTSSSTQAAPTSTSGGLLHGILPGLGQSSSASSAASPTPTASPSGSNTGGGSATNSGSDADSSTASSSKDSSNTADPTGGPSDESPTSTSKGVSPTGTENGTAPTGSADGSDGTTSQTSTATSTNDGTGSSTTVTAGRTSTASQGSGSTPTNINTHAGNGSDSGSSAASNIAAPAPTSTTSNGSDSDSGSGSSSGSAAASTTTTNPYWYANTQSLNLAPSSTWSAKSATQTSSHSSDSDSSSSSSSSTNTNNEPDSSTAWLPGPNNNAPSTPAPQDLPTTIVPSADSYNQPENTTSIGLLFKQDMKWTWVISQADLTAQIFAFMPDLVGHAVSLDSSKISTVKLASYSPETHDAATTNTLSSARTLYMAYVPTENVEEIQAMISNTSSPFYTSAAAGAPQQLASQVDPTFNILSVAGQVATGAKQKATSGSGGAKDSESTLRSSLIGVGCGLAGCFAIAVGGLLWRKQRKDKLEAAGGGAGGNNGGISRAHTIRSFSGGLRETWAPDALDQHRALDTAGQMQQVWSPHDAGMGLGLAMGHAIQPMQSHSDGFGGYIASDPSHDAVHANVGGGYVNMNRSSRMTERSNYSDLSQMTEAQRIQYDYESRRSLHSTSDHSNSHGSHSEHSTESAGMLSTYQGDYRIPRQHTSNHAFGTTPPPRSNSVQRTRRRGSVASSSIGRPEMMSNSVLL